MEKGASVFSKTPNLFNKSCWDISQRAPNKILTGNRALDKHFGGGIALGQIIELIGNSGTGKTQMCLQLCLNVQIPKTAGGLEGSALFIDSRQDFHPDRLLGLALDLAKQYKHKVPEFKALEMLKKIHHVRCPNLVQLMATVLSCHRHIADHPDIKLIVIDSLAFSLRMLEDGAQRYELLLELHESMRRLQRQHELAWVVTNVLTHRCFRSQFRVVPALGEMHSHLINERIWFSGSSELHLGKSWRTSRLIKECD
ncbi:DNA repair protein RAD51 homolog 3 isoform X1 [Drosophila takahashii]|uniref:DNA repair protein RAD51 homolog 3 isoform X1 n=1 Tax=Drosophila takahashii TaxID=29030 RepID=UPI001CF90777|nr:DNA repair protein RAD51 homolog 3 [Drosophila takahashii]